MATVATHLYRSVTVAAAAVVMNGRANIYTGLSGRVARTKFTPLCVYFRTVTIIVMHLSTNKIGILATEYYRRRGEENLATSLVNG